MVVWVHVPLLSLQFSDPQPQHLIFSCQVGGLGLVESAFVSSAVSPCNVYRGRWTVFAAGAMA